MSLSVHKLLRVVWLSCPDLPIGSFFPDKKTPLSFSYGGGSVPEKGLLQVQIQGPFFFLFIYLFFHFLSFVACTGLETRTQANLSSRTWKVSYVSSVPYVMFTSRFPIDDSGDVFNLSL